MGMAASTNGFDADDEGGYTPMAEINITPMVDVMLVLLDHLHGGGAPHGRGRPRRAAEDLGRARRPG